MTKFIDPKDQKAAREKLRLLNNESLTRGLTGGGGDKRRQPPPIPKAKTFNVNEWKAIVDRMGQIARQLAMVETHTETPMAKVATAGLEALITQLNRDLLGGTK